MFSLNNSGQKNSLVHSDQICQNFLEKIYVDEEQLRNNKVTPAVTGAIKKYV